MNVREFIRSEWERCEREYKEQTKEGFFALPYKFVPPSSRYEGFFPFICYWDTYFTNLGLIIDGYIDDAQCNTDNIKYLIDKMGYMPNAAGSTFANRSQFPVYAQLVWDVYTVNKNLGWLDYSLLTLEKEYYDFWMKQRMTPCGLNHYDTCATDPECDEFYDYVGTRIDQSAIPADEKTAYGRHFFAEAESGWDFNARFYHRCRDFAPVDLNSQLYVYEKILGQIYDVFGMKEKSAAMTVAMARRKQLMDRYCRNKDNGMYYDYDFVNDKLSEIESCASFLPYYAGISSDAESILKLLPILECEYGLSCCKKVDKNYQWGYPNMWPNLMYFAYEALSNCGLTGDANRIAAKYMETVEKSYAKTGKVWEKYDAITGLPTEVNEYGISELLGWAAGVYCYLEAKNVR
jgi:alpha,alpha-trehalase